MRPDDSGVDDQILEVGIIGQGLENPSPDAFGAPSAEATGHAVPAAKRLRWITPGRTRADDPQHALDKHAIIAPRRSALIRPANDQTRYSISLAIRENQPIHNAHGFLPKESLES